MELAYAIAGLVVGFAVGLTGIGGGALMTPILHLGFGIPVTTAVGTDLLYAAITKLSGVYVHARAGTVRWGLVGRLALGSIPAAVVTVVVVRMLDIDGETLESLILRSLSIAVLLTAVFILIRGPLQRFLEKHYRQPSNEHGRVKTGTTIIGGVVIGVLVTLTSVGAGVLGTTMLLMLYPRMTTVAVIGTEIAHAVPLTLVAGLGHLSLGSVDFALLGSLLVGSLPGVYFGSRLGTRVPDRLLRPVLAGMLIFIGYRLGFA